MEIVGNHKEIVVQADGMKAIGICDVGCVRGNNEDNFILSRLWNDNYILAVAIDGVGGQEGGEVAAAIAAESISSFLTTYANGDLQELLGQAVLQANNDIYSQRKQNPKLEYMSCVLTAAIIDSRRGQVFLAHVGDTRLYLYSDGKLQKLSHDHSLVGYREERGDLTEEQAMHHPQRNIINRDVGSENHGNTSFIEVGTFPLYGKNILMLCTDGLCDMITSTQMTDILSRVESLEVRCRALIEAAKNAGGRDNVTVLLIELTSDKKNTGELKGENIDISSTVHYTSHCDTPTDVPIDERTSPSTPTCIKKKSTSWFITIALAVVLSLILGGLFSYIYITNDKSKKVELKRTETDEEQDTILSYTSEKEVVEDYRTAMSHCCSKMNVMSISQVAELFEYHCYNSIKDSLPDSITAIAVNHELRYERFVDIGEMVWCECSLVEKDSSKYVFNSKLLTQNGISASGRCVFLRVNRN